VNRDLDRALWRYEVGYSSAEQMSEKCQDAIDGVLQRMAAMSTQLAGLANRPSALVHSCDSAISSASAAKDAKQYREALAAIRRGEDSLTGIGHFLAARAAHDAAKEALWALEEITGSDYLWQFVTITSIRRLVVDAEVFLEKGEYRQAGFVSRMCRQATAELQEIECVDEAQTGPLRNRLSALAQLCSPNALLNALWMSGSEAADGIARVGVLIAQGYLRLAGRLIDDFDAALASLRVLTVERKRHLTIVGNHPAGSRPRLEVLSALVLADSVEGAVSHLLEETLSAVSTNLGALGERVKIVAANVAPERDALPEDRQPGAKAAAM